MTKKIMDSKYAVDSVNIERNSMDSSSGLNWSRRPYRIIKGEIKPAKYQIWAFGLSSDTVHDVILDGAIELIQPHPLSELYLCPKRGHTQPDVATSWFYADCIAYEHDLPVMVKPTLTEIHSYGYRYADIGPPKNIETSRYSEKKHESRPSQNARPFTHSKMGRTFLLNQFATILSETQQLRHGPCTFILFNGFREYDCININYRQKYARVQKEIGLFSTAMRQADFLGHFMTLYRVIESVANKRHVEWIRDHLSHCHTASLPPIWIGHDEYVRDNPRNLMTVYKRRALSRIRTLRAKYGSDGGIARYLYGKLRCGISHGKRDVIRGDISSPYFEVAKDCTLMNFLARIAIEQKRHAADGTNKDLGQNN